MTSTVLVKDVLWRAAVLLQDKVPQYQRFTEFDLVEFLMDAQNAITKYLPMAASRIDSIRLQTGTRQSIDQVLIADCIPSDGSTPTTNLQGAMLLEIVRNMGLNGSTPGNAIRITEKKMLDVVTPTWHTVTAAAVASYMYDPVTPKHFYITPGLSARAWIEIRWTVQPPKIPNTGTPGSELYLNSGSSPLVIGVGDEYIDDLVNYVVARANMTDSEWADGNKAVAFAGMFTSSLNARSQALTGSNPNLKMLPFAPSPVGQATS